MATALARKVDMNLFATNTEPELAARDLDDKRLVKMVLETAQLLSTALRVNGVDCVELYKATHANHPVNVWVRNTRSNFLWTVEYGLRICDEYQHRYGRTHGSRSAVHAAAELYRYITDGPLEEFHNSARNLGKGLDFTSLPVVDAYRAYLVARWNTETPRWTKRGIPSWLSQKNLTNVVENMHA